MPRFRVAVFDVDGTLWDRAMWQIAGPPFELATPDGSTVRDKSGIPIRLRSGVKDALGSFLDKRSPWHGVKIALASSTERPEWVEELLDTFQVHDQRLGAFFPPELRVFRKAGVDKMSHLREIANAVGCEMDEILFLDNELKNVTAAAAVGVHAMDCPNGMDEGHWHRATEAHVGVTGWRRRDPVAKGSVVNVSRGSSRGTTATEEEVRSVGGRWQPGMDDGGVKARSAWDEELPGE